MMTETKIERSKRLRMAVTVGHRKRMGLCISCGKEIHTGECIPDYKKADNRKVEIEGKMVDIQQKKITIISYRKKKKLCTRCGKEMHGEEPCIEIYDQVDHRTVEEKCVRPAVIPTPKFKPTTILDDITAFNNKEIKIQLEKTADIVLQRSFIVLCIQKSNTGNIVEFSCISYLAKKFQDDIICIIGNQEKEFPYSDLMKLRRMTNIKYLSNNQQEIVNFLWSSKLLISFENDYTDYCKKNKLPVCIFEKGKNATSFFKDTQIKI